MSCVVKCNQSEQDISGCCCHVPTGSLLCMVRECVGDFVSYFVSLRCCFSYFMHFVLYNETYIGLTIYGTLVLISFPF